MKQWCIGEGDGKLHYAGDGYYHTINSADQGYGNCRSYKHYGAGVVNFYSNHIRYPSNLLIKERNK